jgi:acylphosphatase
MTIRRRVIVTGRVQGVGFRQSCHHQAVAVGIGGWVQNNFDGTVEAVLEGEREAVERMLAWMRVGPRGAIVTDVHVVEEPPGGDHSFVVK